MTQRQLAPQRQLLTQVIQQRLVMQPQQVTRPQQLLIPLGRQQQRTIPLTLRLPHMQLPQLQHLELRIQRRLPFQLRNLQQLHLILHKVRPLLIIHQNLQRRPSILRG